MILLFKEKFWISFKQKMKILPITLIFEPRKVAWIGEIQGKYELIWNQFLNLRMSAIFKYSKDWLRRSHFEFWQPLNSLRSIPVCDLFSTLCWISYLLLFSYYFNMQQLTRMHYYSPYQVQCVGKIPNSSQTMETSTKSLEFLHTTFISLVTLGILCMIISRAFFNA